jgi:hypothetical protein
LPRYTIIVLRYVKEDRRVILTAIDGTPASTPSVPSVVRDAQYYDICLAKIYVNASVSSITDANITDTRNDSDVCGYVTGLIEQVDTSDLYDQWEAAYDEAAAQLEQTNEDFSQEALSLMQNEQIAFMNWFDTLTSRLRVDTYIQKYEHTFDPASTGSTALPWSQLPGYTYNEQDVIIASINGLEAVRSYDYAVDSYSIDFFNLSTSVSSSVHVVVLKSRIGYNASEVDENIPVRVNAFTCAGDEVNNEISFTGDADEGTCFLSVIGAFDTGYSVNQAVTENNSAVICEENIQNSQGALANMDIALIESWGSDKATYSCSGVGDQPGRAVGAVYQLPSFFGDPSSETNPRFVLVDSRFYHEDNGRPKQIVIDPGNYRYIVIAFAAVNGKLGAKCLDGETVMRVNGTALECLRANLPWKGGMGSNAIGYSVSNPESDICVCALYASSYMTAVVELQFAKNAHVTGYAVYKYLPSGS